MGKFFIYGEKGIGFIYGEKGNLIKKYGGKNIECGG